MSRASHVFHTGELAQQARAQVPDAYREKVAHAIRSEMPQQHRDFFESLPVLRKKILSRSALSTIRRGNKPQR